MEQEEKQRWTMAAQLLDELLDIPPEDRRETAIRLGSQAGVENELLKLLEGLDDESILDQTVDSVIDAIGGNPEPLTGQTLGEWLVGEEIGRGGMSVVYRATRKGERFEQVAALKVLATEFLSDSHIESFHRECQALSALSHPGIARLIHSGLSDDGQPYLVIEHIEGQPIDQYVRDQKPDTQSTVRLMIQLVHAVAHAHRHLFVHRDIKPGNVLVDHRGDPHLLDFGVVQWLDSDLPAGTLNAYSPGFAPPEQVAGDAVSTSVDIYSLGKLLEHLADICGTDTELSAIVRKASAEAPSDRYPDVASLAADLEAWKDHRPVIAMAGGWAYRTRRFCRRNWQWLGVTGALLLTMTAGLLATGYQARQAQLQSERHQAIANFMLSMFEQADVLNAGADLKVTQLLEDAATRAAEQLAGQPQALAALYTLIASGQTELTNYEATQQVLDRTKNIIDEAGLSAEQQAEYHIQRARLLYELGDYTSAEQQSEVAMNLLSPSGDSSDTWFTAGANRVSYLVDGENYEQALALSDMLLAQSAGLGLEPATEVLLAHRHAVALEVNGRMEEALAEYHRAVSLQEQSSPQNQLGRAQILGDLGIALYASEDYQEAETVLAEVIDIYKATFDIPHPRISTAMHNYAFVVLDQGRIDEASSILRQTYEMSEALHGPDHIDTILEKITYGVVLQDAGDHDQAEAIYRESLAKLETVAPEMRVMRGSVHSYLADLKFLQKDYRASRTHYQLALSMYSELPDDHPRVVRAEERLAEISTRPR